LPYGGQLLKHVKQMKNTPKISVTFDIGCLDRLALKEAQNIPMFKGKTLESETVFSELGEQYFEGIKVTAIEKGESR